MGFTSLEKKQILKQLDTEGSINRRFEKLMQKSLFNFFK